MRAIAPSPPHAARWGLALAAAGVLLAASPSVASYYAPPKLVFLALGAAWAWACILRRPEASFRPDTPLDLPLAALGLVLLLSAAASEDPAVSVIGSYSMYAYGLLPLGLCAALFYGTVCSEQGLQPAPALRFCLWAGLASASYGLLQKAGVELVWGLPSALAYGRITSLQGNPTFLGSCLLMLLPVALHFVLDRKGTDRSLGGVAFVLISTAVVLTLSRAAWLGAAAGCTSYLVWTGRIKARGFILGSVLLVCGLAVVAKFRPVAHSDSMRLRLWESALQIFRQDPWLGSGPDTFQSALGRAMTDGYLRTHGRNVSQNNAHNDLLQVLTTTGLAGLLAYLGVLLGVARAARQALSDPARRAAAAALAGALIGLFIQAKFNAAPLASLSLASVFAGLLVRPGKEPLPRTASVAATLFCLVALGIAGRLYWADRAQMTAIAHANAGRNQQALDGYRRSSRLNPAETSYQLARTRLLINLAKTVSEPAVRLRFLEEAVAAARSSTAWRPASVTAQQSLGVSLTLLSVSAGPDSLAEAEQAFDRALKLDRGLPGLLENRIKVARLRKDETKAKELEASLAALLQLTGG